MERWMSVGDQNFRLTPGKVLAALKKRGRCCGCFPAMIELMIEAVEAWKADLSADDAHHGWADTTLTHPRLLEQRRGAAHDRVATRNRTKRSAAADAHAVALNA
ncbi:MAG: hypothetical protein AAGF59_14900 [Pseudomonadota bacterium]